MIVRLATPDDAAAIAAIYAPYVSDSFVSFETEAPDETEMRRRIADGGSSHPWLVAQAEGGVAGYASASPFRPRAAYRYAVETSVYLDPSWCGRGVGRTLYAALLDLLERQGFVQAIGAISLPNEASVRLHRTLGSPKPGSTARSAGNAAAGAMSACGSGRSRRRRCRLRSRNRSRRCGGISPPGPSLSKPGSLCEKPIVAARRPSRSAP